MMGHSPLGARGPTVVATILSANVANTDGPLGARTFKRTDVTRKGSVRGRTHTQLTGVQSRRRPSLSLEGPDLEVSVGAVAVDQLLTLPTRQE